MSKKNTPLDKELIRELASLLDETGLSEIEIEQSGFRVRVARNMIASASVDVPSVVHGSVSPLAAAPGAAPASDEHPGTVHSPMVGTIYLAPEPAAAKFAEIGTVVTKGQTVLIVEAMKTMNHIPAPQGGTVMAILVEDGQPVEFGEPLIVIE